MIHDRHDPRQGEAAGHGEGPAVTAGPDGGVRGHRTTPSDGRPSADSKPGTPSQASPKYDLPTRQEAWQRLRDAAPPEWVLRHCLCVEGLAMAMAQRARGQGHEVDEALVARGALLHDIGRSRSQGIDHAHLGADMLRAPPPLPEVLARVVETHTGAGLTAEEAAAAGLPPLDYVPRTLEQRIVAHADNLYSGEKRLTLTAVLAKYEAKGLADAAHRIAALHNALASTLGIDPETIEATRLKAP